jgi:ABC-type sugar transport system ATPase subunit
MVALPHLDEKKAEIGRKIRIVMHAEDIELSESFSENGQINHLRGQIYNLDFLGKTKRYTIRSSDGNTFFVEVHANGHTDLQIGQTVEMIVRPENMHVFDAQTEESLKNVGGQEKSLGNGLLNTG